jgi:hypothetical protein
MTKNTETLHLSNLKHNRLTENEIRAIVKQANRLRFLASNPQLYGYTIAGGLSEA